MAWGGVRKGAGRRRHTPNKRKSFIAAEALKQGISPLEFVLQVMRNEDNPLPLRCEMASIALPYCHARIGPRELPNDASHPGGSVVLNILAIPNGQFVGVDEVEAYAEKAVALPQPVLDLAPEPAEPELEVEPQSALFD